MQPRELLRLSYWVGIMVDGLAAMMMLGQAIFAHPSPLTHYIPGLPYRYAMGMGGSLMVGWALLLIWADRDPEARRGVLPITVVVIFGLLASGLAAALAGFTKLSSLLPLLLIEVALIVLFSVSYLLSRPPAGSSGSRSRAPATSATAKWV